MQPQNSLNGANAGTSTPQTMKAPQQLNGNAMNQQVQRSQLMGTPSAQAVTMAASNPNNRYYAKGGPVNAPTVDQIHETNDAPTTIDAWAKLLSDSPALKEQQKTQNDPSSRVPPHKPEQKQSMDDVLSDTANFQFLKDRANLPQQYAKGGAVSKMALKDIVKMLAAHPDVMNNARMGAATPLKSPDMAKGGMATANTQGKVEERSHGKGLMAMNDDVGTYAEGGEVNPYGDNMGKSSGLLKMAVGGGLEGDEEQDNITGYGQDGTPTIENADGTQSSGDINQLLGRPKNAPTNQLAKGGEEAGNQPPPGSMKEEVADNVPAMLSGGEFVFSADVVRFYGLRTLNMMMEHARDALTEMNNEGTIRHPGDGKDKPTDEEGGGQFVQDAKPDENTYKDNGMDSGQESKSVVSPQPVKGLLNEHKGGMTKRYAVGGEVLPDIVSGVGDIVGAFFGDPGAGDQFVGLLSNADGGATKGAGVEGQLFGSIEGKSHDQVEDQATGKPGTGLNAAFNPGETNAASKGESGLMSQAGNGASFASMFLNEGGLISAEEQSLAKGGDVYRKNEYPVGRDNMISAHPKGGSVLQDYAKGGVVTSGSKNMFPKKSESLIPTGESKIPGLKKSFSGTPKLPKMAKGGLLDNENMTLNKELHQSYIGS